MAERGLHIAVVRLVDFMLHGLSLREAEHDHLARCETCKEQMIEASSKALHVEQESTQGCAAYLERRLHPPINHLLSDSCSTKTL